MHELSHAKEALKETGVAVIPDVLTEREAASARADLLAAAEAYRMMGGETHMPVLDPNDRNIRVFNLIGLHPRFRDLILNPIAVAMVRALLGDHYMISNFTANIALPGARSMAVHSDQALVAPAPWLDPWSINIIWCLDDVTEENGGTLYLPGSHRVTTLKELPRNAKSRMLAFEAPAGSIIAMDGRVWHTSGENVTKDRERALLFGYYSRGFLRPQVNWNAILPPEALEDIDGELYDRLGLGPAANVAEGAALLTNPL